MLGLTEMYVELRTKRNLNNQINDKYDIVSYVVPRLNLIVSLI